MSDVSEAAKARVAELIDAANWPDFKPAADWLNFDIVTPAVFARFVQQVSDAAKGYFCNGMGSVSIPDTFAPFILAEPVDPLAAEADRLASGHRVWADEEEYDAAIALALVALRRGIELAKAGDA